MTVKVKKLHPNAKLPERGSQEAAGLDLFAAESVLIPPRGQATIQTGIAIALEPGTVGLIWPRSKLAVRKGLDIMAGVVDSDYRGEVMIALRNHSDKPVEIMAGDKAAQMLIQEVRRTAPRQVEVLPETERGAEGINSTDMRYR